MAAPPDFNQAWNNARNAARHLLGTLNELESDGTRLAAVYKSKRLLDMSMQTLGEICNPRLKVFQRLLEIDDEFTPTPVDIRRLHIDDFGDLEDTKID